jgi:hypothetical protein
VQWRNKLAVKIVFTAGLGYDPSVKIVVLFTAESSAEPMVIAIFNHSVYLPSNRQ